MLYWILQTTVFSILFIALVHHIVRFLKTTLTVPKVKDLVNNRNQKYETIYNVVSNAPSEQLNLGSYKQPEYSIHDLLPTNMNISETVNTTGHINVSDNVNMKNELKHFLKSHLQERPLDTTEISDLNTVLDTKLYSSL